MKRFVEGSMNRLRPNINHRTSLASLGFYQWHRNGHRELRYSGHLLTVVIGRVIIVFYDADITGTLPLLYRMV